MERNRERRNWDDRKKKQGQSDHLYTDNTVDIGRHRIGISDRTVDGEIWGFSQMAAISLSAGAMMILIAVMRIVRVRRGR